MLVCCVLVLIFTVAMMYAFLACIDSCLHFHNVVCTLGASGRLPMLPGNGVPVAMENDEQTPEEAEQALAEALTARIASLDAQLAKLGVLGRR